jgi:adenylate cyclase
LAVGEGTRAAAPEFAYRELDLVRVKGKNEPLAIFEPLGLPSELDPATLAELERWHAALALVRSQQWDAAEAAVAALQQEQPECGLYRLFAANIARHRAHPPGPEWDGVTNYDSK